MDPLLCFAVKESSVLITRFACTNVWIGLFAVYRKLGEAICDM